jgi:antitoxin ParD1/3/4
MNVSLTPEQQRFVEAKVASGQYTSAEEVVRDALAVLRAQDVTTPEDVGELRRLLAPAIQQADRGELTPLDMDEVKRKAEGQRRSRKVD